LRYAELIAYAYTARDSDADTNTARSSGAGFVAVVWNRTGCSRRRFETTIREEKNGPAA
jgi:hypothetical protein